MSDAAAEVGELISFDGAVSCEHSTTGACLRLRGSVQAGNRERRAAELLFSGLEPALAQVPELLHEVSVLEPEAAAPSAPRRFRIRSSEGGFELRARSAQRHGDIAAAFFAVLPPPRVPYTTRLGWTLLLWMLRLPGAARLLSRHEHAIHTEEEMQ